MTNQGKHVRGILQPSTEYLDIEAINRELLDKLDERDAVVIYVWFDDYGLNRKDVAQKLNLSEDGLKARIRKIYTKLEVRSKEEAVLVIMKILKII